MSNESPRISVEVPSVYVAPGREIKNVIVQEADLKRLKDHLFNIKTISTGFDFFSIFFGATLTETVTVAILWVSTKTAPVGYMTAAFVLLALSFLFHAIRGKKIDLKTVQFYIDEAKKDLDSIFTKANLESDNHNNSPSKS